MFSAIKNRTVTAPCFAKALNCNQIAFIRRLSKMAPLAASQSVCWSHLKNGMKVVTAQTVTPLACVSLLCRVGPVFEDVNKLGITHFIEHIAYKGFRSENIPSQDAFEKLLINSGIKMTAKTFRDHQVFNALCPNEAVPEALMYLSLIPQDLLVHSDSIKLAVEEVRQEQVDIENNMKKLVFEFLHQTAFQGTPLARPVVGPTHLLETISKPLLTSFIEQRYQPCSLTVCVTSTLDKKSVECMVDKLFGGMKPTAENISVPSRYTGSEMLYRNDDMTHCYMTIAFEFPGYCNMRNYLMSLLLKYIIGSFERSQSFAGNNNVPRLAQAAASGICVSYEAFYIPYYDVGLWGIYYVTTHDQLLDDVMHNIHKSLMGACYLLTPADFQRAVNQMKLDLLRRATCCIMSNYDLGLQVMYNNRIVYLSDMFNDISEITHTKIMNFVEPLLVNRCPVVAGVGPVESQPEYNRTRQYSYWLRV